MATKSLCLFEDRWLLAVYDLIRDNFFFSKKRKIQSVNAYKGRKKDFGGKCLNCLLLRFLIFCLNIIVIIGVSFIVILVLYCIDSME